jgi:hypothetical protein
VERFVACYATPFLHRGSMSPTLPAINQTIPLPVLAQDPRSLLNVYISIYFILFHFILFYFISFYFISFHFTSFYLY